MDPNTDQLKLFLSTLKPTGAAVFNLGGPGAQYMYFVAESGRICERLMAVGFMMAESSTTPTRKKQVPLEPAAL
eukprot:5350675-Amphidinium_carterae.1